MRACVLGKFNIFVVTMKGNKLSDFQRIIESLNDLIYELDEQGRFIYSNHTMEKISGYSKKELKDIHYWELVLPEEVKDLKNFYKKQAADCKRNTYYEFTMRTKSGKHIQIGQNVSMLFDGHGNIMDVIAIARDISAIKDLHKKFKEKESEAEETGKLLQLHTENLNTQTHLLDSILNAMAESVAVYDVEGNLLKINEAGRSMVGFSNSSMDSKDLPDKLELYYADEETPATRSIRWASISH